MNVPLISLLLSSAVSPSGADDLEPGTTWEAVREEESSIVFGRLEGRFDGTEYRGRKIRVREKGTGDEHSIEVDQGLGYFDAVLPVGTYEILSIEALYVPPIRPMNPRHFTPVPQRYALRAVEGGSPGFPVVTEMPLYLGTIRSTVGLEGTVYEGHVLQIVDEYDEAWGRFETRHPALVASLREKGVHPQRYFFLKPTPADTPLALDTGNDPIARARAYVAEAKFGQATEWLRTIVPISDAERIQLRLLMGEALLGDRKFTEAIEELGEVLLAEPKNLRALRLLARAHAFAGNTEDSFNLYQALARFVPDDAEASLHIGYRHALRSEKDASAEAFDRAFESNFDYLLHDLSPYAIALRGENVEFDPPEAFDGVVRIPKNMRSRRGSQGAFGLLLDHKGRVLAAHVTPDVESTSLASLMSIVRARFRPAKLNGVPVPCLVLLGVDDLAESER